MSKIDATDNFAGPFKTLEDAHDAANTNWGGGDANLLWRHNGAFYINDGIDPDTGDAWKIIPSGAEWVDVPEDSEA